ncbi:MAG: hypothetical protein Q9211_000973 [Gyalolechia sp. 1 TL-2023]
MRSAYRKFRRGPVWIGQARIAGPAAPPEEAWLLARLPLEIRQTIWRDVLGDSLLHLTWIQNDSAAGKRLRCFTCRAFHNTTTPTGADTDFRCRGSQKQPCFFSGPAQTPFGALQLLLTCRQIYLEAVDFLYATNTFGIDGLEPLQMFIQQTGQRVHSIQTVHVNMAMWKIRCRDINRTSSEAFAEWTQIWGLLAQHFIGLLHVRLDIYGTSREGLRQTDLQPLLTLSGLKNFDLAVWRDSHEQGSAGQDLALSQPLEDYVRVYVCGH